MQDKNLSKESLEWKVLGMGIKHCILKMREQGQQIVAAQCSVEEEFEATLRLLDAGLVGVCFVERKGDCGIELHSCAWLAKRGVQPVKELGFVQNFSGEFENLGGEDE